MTGSHVLIVDAPGVGRTTLVRMLAKALGPSFQRIHSHPFS
ncbi:MAG: AAA family ATPase [Actinomycetota bacterium]